MGLLGGALALGGIGKAFGIKELDFLGGGGGLFGGSSSSAKGVKTPPNLAALLYSDQARNLTNQGFSNLADILASQGRTNPAMFENMISGIMRGTQAQQQAVANRSARSGLSRSGLSEALQAAIGQSGVQQARDIRAQEAQLEESRRRDDLQLLHQLLTQPALQTFGLQSGIALENQARSDQRRSAEMQALTTLLGGLFASRGA